MKSRLAFSNGTEFYIWQESWCFRCKKDEEFRVTEENGCEIIAISMFSDGEIPEWSEDPTKDGWPNVICSAFEPVRELGEK